MIDLVARIVAHEQTGRPQTHRPGFKKKKKNFCYFYFRKTMRKNKISLKYFEHGSIPTTGESPSTVKSDELMSNLDDFVSQNPLPAF